MSLDLYFIFTVKSQQVLDVLCLCGLSNSAATRKHIHTYSLILTVIVKWNYICISITLHEEMCNLGRCTVTNGRTRFLFTWVSHYCWAEPESIKDMSIQESSNLRMKTFCIYSRSRQTPDVPGVSGGFDQWNRGYGLLLFLYMAALCEISV